MTDIKLEILSPEGIMVKCNVDRVSLPGTKGPFVVLKNHAPLISSLEKGEIVYSSGDEKKSLAINSGFVKVKENRVSVCVDIG